jgi:hypothetical protein
MRTFMKIYGLTTMFANFLSRKYVSQKVFAKMSPPNKFSPVKFVKIEKISHFCERGKSIFALAPV